MKRIGTKGSGKFERISWSEALLLIANKFTDLTDTVGAESILPFHYDGSNGLITSGGMDERFWNRLGASQLGTRDEIADSALSRWPTALGR